jgi:hypothetical protein
LVRSKKFTVRCGSDKNIKLGTIKRYYFIHLVIFGWNNSVLQDLITNEIFNLKKNKQNCIFFGFLEIISLIVFQLLEDKKNNWYVKQALFEYCTNNIIIAFNKFSKFQLPVEHKEK